MTLKDFFLKSVILISATHSPDFAWKQMENLLEERFLEYMRLNKDSKEVLEALYERLTGNELNG